MEKSASRKQVIERYSNPSNRGLGLLAVAFQTLFSRSIDNDHSAKRWIAAKKVAHKLGTTPLEILVLDVPTAMMPEKSKELIENPSVQELYLGLGGETASPKGWRLYKKRRSW